MVELDAVDKRVVCYMFYAGCCLRACWTVCVRDRRSDTVVAMVAAPRVFAPAPGRRWRRAAMSSDAEPVMRDTTRNYPMILQIIDDYRARCQRH